MSGNRIKAGECPVLQLTPCFNDSELDAMRGLVDTNSEPGTMQYPHNENLLQVRRSRVTWVFRRDYDWVYERLWGAAIEANEKYGFDIEKIQAVQVAYYDESEQGFYLWHSDFAFHDMTRKLSISVPLNNPDEYEGGGLQFATHGMPFEMPQVKGIPLAFPSFVLHQVAPVTKGRRYSMVAWIEGPPFR